MRTTSLIVFVVTGAVAGMAAGTPARAAVAQGTGSQARAQAHGQAHHGPPSQPAGPGDPATTITFTVTSGALTLSVPASAGLGSGAPGTSLSAPIGPCTVTDARALLSASWTVTASETDFVNGPSLIPATNATYTVGTITTTGTITATPSNITLSNSAQTVLTGSSGVGDNTASWNPTIGVSVPASAVGGTYTGTLVQSVA